MKVINGDEVTVTGQVKGASMLNIWNANSAPAAWVWLTPPQMRRLAAMLTKAANRIDAKRKRGAK